MQRWKTARDLPTVVALTVILLVVIQTFVAQPFEVRQESMLPRVFGRPTSCL